MNLREVIIADNELCRSLQEREEKEIVQKEQAVTAFAVLNKIAYRKTADFYIGAACLNLLNTYVKQKDSEIGYHFKAYVKQIVHALSEADNDHIRIDLQKDGKMNLLVFQLFGSMQFSFHNIETEEQLTVTAKEHRERYGPLEWDGIRKQKCAVTVFEHAMRTVSRSSDPLLFTDTIEEEKERVRTLIAEGKLGRRKKKTEEQPHDL